MRKGLLAGLVLAAVAVAYIATDRRDDASGFTYDHNKRSLTRKALGTKAISRLENANSIPINAPLYIKRVGLAHAGAPQDIHGVGHDWIEVYNQSNEAIPLEGYRLTDNPDQRSKWVFPDILLPAKTACRVWASGRSGFDAATALIPEQMTRGPHFKLIGHSGKETCTYLVEAKRGLEGDYPANTNGLTIAFQPSEAGPHYLFLRLFALSANPIIIDITCGDNTARFTPEPTKKAQWVKCPLPESPHDAWPIHEGTNSIHMALRKGHLRIDRFVPIHAERPLGQGDQDVHCNFKLSRRGEFIGLFDPEKRPLHYFQLPAMEPGDVYTYNPSKWNRYALLHAREAAKSFKEPPHANLQSGLVTPGEKLTFMHPSAAAKIHYTLDGSIPHNHSPIYREPIPILSNTPVRARAFFPNSEPSILYEATFRTTPATDLPVLSLTMEPDHMFGSGFGILFNPLQRGGFSERPCHVTFTEPDGTTTSKPAGIRIQGRSSRTVNYKRNFRIYFRTRYGASFWPGSFYEEPGADKAQAIVLVARRFIANSVAHSAMREAGFPSPRTRLTQFYVNGKSLGLYLIVEDVNDINFLEHQFGHLDLDVIKEKTKNPIKMGNEQAFERDWKVLYEKPSDAFTYDELSRIMAPRYFSKWAALIQALAIGDSGQGYLVRDKHKPDPAWSIVNWDFDNAFFAPQSPVLFKSSRLKGKIHMAFARHEAFHAIHTEELLSHINHTIRPSKWLPIMDKMEEQIITHLDIEKEGRATQGCKYQDSAFINREYIERFQNARTFMEGRPESLKQYLISHGKSLTFRTATIIQPQTETLLIDGVETTGPYEGLYLAHQNVHIQKPSGEPFRIAVNGVIHEARESFDLPLRAEDVTIRIESAEAPSTRLQDKSIPQPAQTE